MKPAWRKREDAFEEAKRLGALAVVKSLGWSKRRLEQEMELADSEKMFKGRLRNAIQREAQREANKARLLHRDSSRGYTADPHLALVGEAEAVPEEFQSELSKQARDRDREALGELIAAAEDVRAALKDRIESNPEFMRRAGRDVWLVRSRLDALIRNLGKRAA